MNSQEDPALHQALRSLPGRRAPGSLLPGVLAIVRAEAALPWWQRSFRAWPLWARLAVPAGVAGLTGAAVAVASIGSATVSGALPERPLESVAWVGRTASALHGALSALVGSAPTAWSIAGVVLLVGAGIAALLAVASGTVIARLANAPRA